MSDLTFNILIITLNLNSLNTPGKRQSWLSTTEVYSAYYRLAPDIIMEIGWK